MRISELLLAMASELESEDNAALQLAEYHEPSLEKAAEGLLRAASELKKTAAELDKIEPTEEVRDLKEVFTDVAKLAQELDDSGDAELQKRASVLDEILLTFGRPKGALNRFKQAEDAEIDKLREKYNKIDEEKAYKDPKEALDKQNNRDQTSKAVREQVKTYEPLEAPLQTRYCPDHPGTQMMRVGDNAYQCALDKKVYDWKSGFITMKGSKIPGTDVAQQTVDFAFRSQPHSVFDTREQMAHRFAEAKDGLVKKAKDFPKFPDVDVKKKDTKVAFPEFPKEALAHCGVCGKNEMGDKHECMPAEDKDYEAPEEIKLNYPEAYAKVEEDTGMEPDALKYFKDVNGNLCLEIMRGDEYRQEFCWDVESNAWFESEDTPGGAEEYFEKLKNMPEAELGTELGQQGLVSEEEMREFIGRK